MALHAAKTAVTNPEDCLAINPRFDPPATVSDEEKPFYEATLWDCEQGYHVARKAAVAAHDYMSFVRYFNSRDTSKVRAAEHAYAQLVLATVGLQNKMEEWGAPTMWTDGIVDEEGYVTIWNAGQEEIYAWQGGEMDEIKVDENGIGMRNA